MNLSKSLIETPLLDKAGLIVWQWIQALNQFVSGPLARIGRIPKVTGEGKLGESAITDDGATVSSTEPIAVDTGATPANTHIAMRAAGLGTLQFLCYAQNSGQIAFDMDLVSGTYFARATSAARIVKGAGWLGFYRLTGQTVGTAVAGEALSAYMELATGRWGFGGTNTPGYAVDVTGDLNVSGVLRVAGVQVVGARQAAITGPSGGSVIDAQARTAINTIITELHNLGLIG